MRIQKSLTTTPATPRAADVTSEKALSDRFEYPAARRGDQTDDYHGVKVARSVSLAGEHGFARKPRAWIAAENKLTFGYLDTDPAAGRDPRTAHRTVEL